LSSITKKGEIESASRPVDFGELNDKGIIGLMDLSKIVSGFYLYTHDQLLKYLFMDEYYMAHNGEYKYMDDLNT
jgi:hypothetical protein